MTTQQSDQADQTDEAGDGVGAETREQGSAVARALGSGTGRPVLPAIALVLLVALVALVVVNVLHVRRESPRDEVPKAVSDHVVKLLSYTPTTVASDLAKEKSWLTGDFADEYAGLVTKTVAPAAEKGGVTAEASVSGRGVVSSSHDRVELLLFVNITTTRSASKDPEVQGSRVRVVAQRVDGTWKISDLSPA